jgi:hypothetical protein
MEPRPLLEEDATEVETALLRAGRADGPRKEVAARALATIEGLLPEVASEAGSAVPVARHAGLARWTKLVLVAMGLGGVALVAYHFTRPRTVPPAPPPRAVVAEPAPAAPADEPRNIGEAFAVAPDQEPARVRRRAVPGRVRNEGQTSLDSSLGQETLLLDRARMELDAQRGLATLRLLDQYERQFPHGRLRPEAAILRLAALFQTGRTDAADALAGRLLADEAYQAYAQRIRSLSREAKR